MVSGSFEFPICPADTGLRSPRQSLLTLCPDTCYASLLLVFLHNTTIFSSASRGKLAKTCECEFDSGEGVRRRGGNSLTETLVENGRRGVYCRARVRNIQLGGICERRVRNNWFIMGGFGKNNFYGNNNKGGRRISFVLVIERYIFSVVFLEYNIYCDSSRKRNEIFRLYFICAFEWGGFSSRSN